jgi:hypothetical protein
VRDKPKRCVTEPVGLLEVESGRPDRRGGVPVGVATTGGSRPQRSDRVLQQAQQRLGGAHVFEEAQLPARDQDATDLGERAGDLRHRAEHQGHHRGVEGGVGCGQRVGVSGHDPDRYRRVRGCLLGQGAQVVFRLDGEHFGDGVRVVAEVQAVAGADLDHPPSEPG